MNNKEEAKKFLKEVFKDTDSIQVPLASEYIHDDNNSSYYATKYFLGYKEAPYLDSTENRQLSVGQIHEGWLDGELDPKRHKILGTRPLKPYNSYNLEVPSSSVYEPEFPRVNLRTMTIPSWDKIKQSVWTNKSTQGITLGLNSEQDKVKFFHNQFPLFNYRTLFFTEYANPYLSNYRTKYRFKNLFESELVGLIFSRLYSGT